MAQFQFPLEKVLRWRALELASEEAKLELLIREQLRLQTMRASLSAEKSKLDQSLDSLADLRGVDLRAAAAYNLRLKRETQNLMQQAVRCERELGEQKKKYRAAKQRLRLLEELKARKLAEWRKEQTRELEALATESFLALWNRDL